MKRTQVDCTGAANRVLDALVICSAGTTQVPVICQEIGGTSEMFKSQHPERPLIGMAVCHLQIVLYNFLH